jgi:hypothetical protein
VADWFASQEQEGNGSGDADGNGAAICAHCGRPGGLEFFFGDGPMVRLHRECEAPYRRFLDEGHGPEGELEKSADDA